MMSEQRKIYMKHYRKIHREHKRIYLNRYRKAHPEKFKSYNRNYYRKLKKNPHAYAKFLLAIQTWQDKNYKKVMVYQKKYRKKRNQRPGYREERAAYTKQWIKKNREKYLASRKRNREKHREQRRAYSKWHRKKNHKRLLEYAKQFREENREKMRGDYWGNSLYKHYRLTIKEYNFLCRQQQNRCAICRRKQKGFHKRLSVDHDHSISKSVHWMQRIRGLLCQRCNLALGHFHDNLTFLRQAIKYLKHPPALSLRRRMA